MPLSHATDVTEKDVTIISIGAVGVQKVVNHILIFNDTTIILIANEVGGKINKVNHILVSFAVGNSEHEDVYLSIFVLRTERNLAAAEDFSVLIGDEVITENISDLRHIFLYVVSDGHVGITPISVIDSIFIN